MKTLLTGHKGFIGPKLYPKLQGEVVGIDLKEGYNLLSCPLPEDVSTIYHLAAQTHVESSWHDPLHDMDNLRITARLVHRYPNAKFIYANSCASVNHKTPYGFSKWASGEYVKQFHTNHVDCIFPNIYGYGSKSVVDIFKDSEEVTIFGDGKQTRDFVHLDDIISGLIKAKDWPVGSYFMGSGKSISVLELAEGKTVRFAPERLEEKEVVVPNTTPDWRPFINVLDYLK